MLALIFLRFLSLRSHHTAYVPELLQFILVNIAFTKPQETNLLL